jgi:hypothetical protein
MKIANLQIGIFSFKVLLSLIKNKMTFVMLSLYLTGRLWRALQSKEM